MSQVKGKLREDRLKLSLLRLIKIFKNALILNIVYDEPLC